VTQTWLRHSLGDSDLDSDSNTGNDDSDSTQTLLGRLGLGLGLDYDSPLDSDSKSGDSDSWIGDLITTLVVAKVLEKLLSEQLKLFLDTNDILSEHQSGFRKQHSTTTAAIKVVNNIIEALDCKNYCAAVFIDLSKAFDTVDHTIMAERLHSIGLSRHTVGWLLNYLSARTQCVQFYGSSSFLPIAKGVPQGSIVGPILFTIYVNNLCNKSKCFLPFLCRWYCYLLFLRFYRAKSRFPPVCLWCHTNPFRSTKVGIKCRRCNQSPLSHLSLICWLNWLVK